MERGRGDPRPLRAAQLLDARPDPPQRAREVRARPGPWHALRSRTRSCSTSFPARWTRNGIATHANEVLSSTDRALRRRRLSAQAGPASRSLGLDASGAFGASYRPAGRGGPVRVHSPTRPHAMFETRADRPGDEALRAEQPDAAHRRGRRQRRGFNPRIAPLSPGEYLVQIRHFNRPAAPATTHLGAAVARDVSGARGAGLSGPRVPPCGKESPA